MELLKKVSIVSALLVAAASTASAFVPRTNKLSNTCGTSTFGSLSNNMNGGLFMSAVTESASDAATGAQTIDNIRLVRIEGTI